MRLYLPAIAAGLALGLRAHLALGACAPVASANDLCAQNADPCVIDGKECLVVPGTTLDFGARAVVLQHGTRLDVGTGIMTVVAGSLELQAGTGLLGHGGAVIVRTQGSISVLRSGATRARIDVADPAAANRIELSATNGTIQVDGYLDARGTNTDGVGGSIDVAGGSILVAGDILTSGGNVGLGGPIAIVSSGGIVLSGIVDGSGGTGGSLDLEANGSVTTTSQIDIRATGAGGDGGVMTVLTTTGSVTLGGKIYMQGDEGTDTEGGASGGELNVFTGSGLFLAADLELSGAPPDGQGGDAFFMSMLDMVQTGLIQAQGRGSQSDGGSVEFDSQRSLTLGPIDLHGGEALPDSGGGLDATAWCDLTVPPGVTITALGDKGENLLHSGGQLAIKGTLKAGRRNLLEYRTLAPTTSSGTLEPMPDVQQNLTLTPCGGFAPVTCRDGVQDPDEECDDHNSTSCDDCSSTCRIEACGNGRVDCGEACDDGNTASGDTCHGDCSRPDNVCGDTIIDGPAEQCDDGNLGACDATHCSATCKLEACGNGTVECNEECDPPNAGTGCTAQCISIPPGCGNGTVAGNEECDDGNTADGDACSHQCRKEICGNGKVDPGEDCDDINTVGCDGCSPACAFEVCGDGVLDCGEECDDGAENGAPGGSCLPDVCRPGPFCSAGSSDPCLPCATTTDCDPLGACGPATCTTGVCTPVDPPTCDDGDACTGVETCDPAVGCKSAAPLDCDDGDACTDDSCDAVAGCVHTSKPPVALLTCRIGEIRAIVTGAQPADIATPIRTKLLKGLAGVEAKVQVASSNPRRAKKALKAARKQVGKLVKLVTKQRGTKIAPTTADAITTGLQGLLPPILLLVGA